MGCRQGVILANSGPPASPFLNFGERRDGKAPWECLEFPPSPRELPGSSRRSHSMGSVLPQACSRLVLLEGIWEIPSLIPNPKISPAGWDLHGSAPRSHPSFPEFIPELSMAGRDVNPSRFPSQIRPRGSPRVGKGRRRFCWNFEASPTDPLPCIVWMLLLAGGSRSEGCHGFGTSSGPGPG